MIIKVISLNVWREALLTHIVAFLQQQNADIICLQEVTNISDYDRPIENRLYTHLQQTLDYPYSAFAEMLVNNTKEAKIPEGVAIFSRYPLSEQSTVFFEDYRADYVDIPENFSTSPRCMQHVVLTTPAGELNVFNMHGVWDLDGDNFSPQRQKMSKLTREATAGKSNVLLMGDTNAKPTNRAMQQLEPTLRSVFGNSVVSTFNMKHKTNPGYATAAVDMMFVSPNIRVLSKDIPQVDVSDHLPLVVELEIG